MLFSFSKYILSVVSFVLLTMSFVFSVTTPVFAQGAVENDVFGVADLADEEEGLVLGSGDIRQVVAQIINVFLGLLGIVAVGIIIYGGYLYMTSNGNEDQISQAKKIIINGVIGLVIILSSFAIAQFFIRNFSNATGVRTGINGEGNGNGGGGGNDVRCEGANPPLFCIPDEQLQCEDIHFFVQSITPSTPGPGVDPTDMNNIVVRAVFTKPVANTFNAASIFTVTNEQGNIVPVEITMSSDRYIAQATVSKGESCAAGVTCFDPGLYTVTVNKDLRSQQTNDQEAMPLEIDLGGDCGRYPNVATFRVNTTNVIDTQAPQISELKVNGKDGNDVVVSRNAAHTITARIQDQNGNGESAGVAYARLRVYEEGEQAATGKVVYEGPVVVEGSSQPFAFSYDYFIPRCVGCSPDKYIIELTAYDIDHNTTVALSSIIVVGPQCDALGAPLEGASRPQECLQQQHTCTQDWQCPSQKCVENRCVAFPVILDVDPWDGAQGNLITLVGRYFGETAGTVEFGIDKNNDGVFTNDDVWVPAELTQCGTSDVWHDDWVVVEVPSDQQLPQDTLTAIRITRADDKTFQDTTVDAHGNKPGPRAGLWQKNATNRPGLCSVVAGSTDQDIQKYVTAGLPNASVIALGIGFGDTQTNQSELLFSGVAAPISQWSVNRVFGQVPSAARVGKLGVHVRVKDVRSNAVPFTVLREGEDVLPIIDSVDPVSATPGSFITLSGQRFGSDVGSVFMADSPELALTCAQTDDNTRPNTCVELLTTLPNCDASASWNDQQVIVGIPESASPRAQYFIVLKKRNGLLTDGNTTLAVVEGKPAPSLCQLVPNRGPAPRADELTVFGNNLLADEGIPSVYFWWKQARVDAIDTWLSESNADRLNGGALLGSTRQDKKLSFYLPVSTQDGVSSMNSGPIRVSVDGVLSNSVYYAVERCTDPGAVPPDAGYRCCTEGIGQGQWVPENRSCPGETMSAGYVWRFTTGKIPEKLRVIEECREQNGVPRVDDPIPSPTPWFGAAQGQGWADGDRACVNADIVIRFSLALDETTVTPSTARIYTCTGDDTPTCNNPVDVSAAFDRIVELNGDQGVLKLRPLPNQQNERTLSPNTWYRVALTSDI